MALSIWETLDRGLISPYRLDYKKAFEKAAYGDFFAQAAQFIGQKFSDHDVVFLNDKNHGNVTQNAFTSSKELMAELKRRGVTHYGLELPVEDQPLIDRLADGRLNKQTYINIRMAVSDYARDLTSSGMRTGVHKDDEQRIYEYEADLIINARQQGIKVKALDPKLGPVYYDTQTKNPVLQNIFIEPEKKFAEKLASFATTSPLFNPDLSQFKASGFFADQRLDTYKKMRTEDPLLTQTLLRYQIYDEDKDNAGRLKNDSFVAFEIAKILLVPGTKMAVQYGKAHTMRKSGDIDSTLNSIGFKTTSVDVMGSKNDFVDYRNLRKECQAPDKSLSLCETPYDTPRIFLDTKTIQTGGTSPKEAIKVQPLVPIKP